MCIYRVRVVAADMRKSWNVTALVVLEGEAAGSRVCPRICRLVPSVGELVMRDPGSWVVTMDLERMYEVRRGSGMLTLEIGTLDAVVVSDILSFHFTV